MSEQLIRTLLNGKSFDGPGRPELIETHISWVILAGNRVYKIKKPLDLGFLDFTSLEQRRTCCEAELRLNRRTAPLIYLDVVPISGTEDAPLVDNPVAPVEYAVRMVRFDQRNTLDHLMERGQIDVVLIQSLAKTLASFHLGIAGAATPPPVAGTPAAVSGPVEDNFRALFAVANQHQKAILKTLHSWCTSTFNIHQKDFERRHCDGFIRECHGDLHLGNIVRIGDQCIPFDCIEFSDSLRWIDISCDIAFTIMDIERFSQPEMAHLLLNEYLQWTGDYASLGILHYYLVYRAMVRAKISMIRATQTSPDAPVVDGNGSETRSVKTPQGLNDEALAYLDLARKYTARHPGRLTMMCGLSGSGKTTVARHIASEHHEIHIRSDVERKRLFGLRLDDSSRAQGLDIYTPMASAQTFACLLRLAEGVISNGFRVVVDATFIEQEVRKEFIALADRMGVPWAIVYCQIDEETARSRLDSRQDDASEAGYAQFLAQRSHFEDFDSQERGRTVEIDTTHEPLSLVDQRLEHLFAADAVPH